MNAPIPADAWAAARWPEVAPVSALSPADSLEGSARAFAELGLAFDADFTAAMVEPARACPALYAHWAREQAKRAAAKREGAR